MLLLLLVLVDPGMNKSDDGQELSDATRITELRIALLTAQRWVMYAAGRESADDPVQAALLLQASADIETTLKRTAWPSTS